MSVDSKLAVVGALHHGSGPVGYILLVGIAGVFRAAAIVIGCFTASDSQTIHPLGDDKSRKPELRDRIAQADPATCAVFAADKIANVGELALHSPRGIDHKPHGLDAQPASCSHNLKHGRRPQGNLR